MGCMSSKEDAPKKPEASKTVGGDDDKPEPIKKVKTNFSDINYTDPSTGRRDTVYAPSEVPEQRPSIVPEVPSEHRVSTTAGTGSPLANGAPLSNGALSGDGAGNGVVGGDVVGEQKMQTIGEGKGEAEAAKNEVPWDALSPGSKPVA
jgi:hypothetical protein